MSQYFLLVSNVEGQVTYGPLTSQEANDALDQLTKGAEYPNMGVRRDLVFARVNDHASVAVIDGASVKLETEVCVTKFKALR